MPRTLFDDDHKLFRESAAAFVDREILPRREEIREQRRIPKELWRTAGEAGFLGVAIPEQYGGSDVDFRYNAIFNEELSRAGMAYSSSFTIHADVCAPYLTRLTTEEQKQRWLPKFCTGEMVTAIGMTEPEAGSDLQGLKTNAKRDGDEWVINGSKTFITNGAHAEMVIVAARTATDPKGRGISLFAIEEGMEGFSRGRKLHKIGQHEADTAELFFENVRVTDDQLIGEVDRGFHHMMEHLAQERLGSAISNTAHAQQAFAVTLEYIKTRKAFGRPVGTFQNSRFLAADLQTRLDVTQSFVDQCVVAHAKHELSAVDAAKAKWWSAEVQNTVIDACVQLHGGYGYMEEYEVAHAWMDARVTKIWAGSNEIMKEIIGRDLGLGEVRG
ncbi:acyl-CoA dehydrogenase family protein [Baekduia sp. Peel2402]|uniref:acyl-CoA dehydrogenase family protein n=1 Tax=Baekduia sp. Peel2402 TaxID=3458296 RepID=UPI00403EDEF2